MNCPNCGLINPSSTQRCDCGYEFFVQAEELGSEDRADGLDAVQSFVNRYFDSPEPQRAPEALRAFLKSPVGQDRNNVTWYLFARIAQDHPWLVREYEPLLREIPEGRTALLLILWQCGDEGTKALLDACQSDSEFAPISDQIVHVLQNWKPGWLSPMERPAESCADLDLLWCEFRATGNMAAIVRRRRPGTGRHCPRQVGDVATGIASRDSRNLMRRTVPTGVHLMRL